MFSLNSTNWREKKKKLLLTIHNYKFYKKYLYKTLIRANTFRIIKLDEILCRIERRIKYSNIKWPNSNLCNYVWSDETRRATMVKYA